MFSDKKKIKKEKNEKILINFSQAAVTNIFLKNDKVVIKKCKSYVYYLKDRILTLKFCCIESYTVP